MKILLLGFPVLKSAFLECGHDVRTCTTDQRGDVWIEEFPVSIDRVFEALPIGWNPDLVLLMDESTEPMFLGLEHLQTPVAWYTIDSHLHLHWHRSYAAVFDFIFVAQKSYVPDYEYDRHRQVVTWLPLFCNPERDRYHPLPKIYDLSFVGRLHSRWKPERSRFLEKVQAKIPVFMSTGEYVSVFNRSKVVLNECAANDVNFRIFEALACGSLLLTERVGNGFEELFQDRQHLLMYDRDNIDQIVELAHYYISHEREREAIAFQGRELVLASHTTLSRAQSIINAVQAADVQSLVGKRQVKIPNIYRQLDPVYQHAADVYALASHRFQHVPSQLRECLRTREAYRKVRSCVLQTVGEERHCSGENRL